MIQDNPDQIDKNHQEGGRGDDEEIIHMIFIEKATEDITGLLWKYHLDTGV